MPMQRSIGAYTGTGVPNHSLLWLAVFPTCGPLVVRKQRDFLCLITSICMHSHGRRGAAAGENHLVPNGGSKRCWHSLCMQTAAVFCSGQICILYKSVSLFWCNCSSEHLYTNRPFHWPWTQSVCIWWVLSSHKMVTDNGSFCMWP